MRWHKDKRVDTEDVLRHPADAAGWKHFDKEFPQFASEPRNVRLGLASDGFNPFGNMSTAYSMWPVVLIPYNLPPWKCMKESNFFMSLLVPGPKSPGKELDVYLQPLIDELKELWNNGVRTFDCTDEEYFRLHACLLWTINDFPAYSDLSGWSTKGYQACPTCKEDTSSFGIKGKISFMGHRRYLSSDHIWRRSRQHDGKFERRPPPVVMNGDEILQQVNSINFPVLSKHPSKTNKKRKRTINWNKKSIFFELPYWSKLLLRHKLDVMHIEKNVCDNLLGTLLNIDGKTKDTINARLDLEDLNIRKELHLQRQGTKLIKPHPTYTLTGSERIDFCKFLKSVKFPDGFVSNISRCVSVNDGKLWGLKTHDSHILLQRLIPIAVRAYLHKDVCTTVVELCNFFRDLCAKTIRVSDLNRLEADIVLILCKLERIFPPAFFDIMIHLAVHLPAETKIVGPVSYSWMYPIERSLRTLKQYVRNKAHPEGSIAEAFIMNECLTFCSMYLIGIETRFNRNPRNDDSMNRQLGCGDFDVFKQNVRPMGGSVVRTLSEDEKRMCHWYVLNNCCQIESYRREHLSLINTRGEDVLDLFRRHQLEFPNWFRTHMYSLRERGEASDDLYSIALGPINEVRTYSGCFVNGLRYHSIERDNRRTTQNSGIMAYEETKADETNYYGVLQEVLDLEYLKCRRVCLFKCNWFDTDVKKNKFRCDLGFKIINTSRFWYTDDPYILATQAVQVFYIDDPKLRSNWKIVQIVQNKQVWDIPESEEVEDDRFELLEACSSIGVDESIHDIPFCRGDVEPTVVDHKETENQDQSRIDDDFINDETEQLQSSDSDGNE
ncbi:uncharacterized protein LOC127149700 [Cucumis melo]|uniref:Uncharacterized protein LOC127149700 n=1 Tax=Cucumis melo TaxID=3656 RepID=A0ABM3KUT1_CUCME|nr:uncharacterized protein LOC127149700 [Cucumis melo]